MARLNPRLVAGVGVLSVFLLLGGSGAAVAIADEGGERSDRKSSSGEAGENGNWRGGSKGESDDRSSNGEIRRGATGAERQGSSGGPQVRVGSGRQDTQQVLPSERSGGGSGSSGGSASRRGSGSDGAGAPSAGFNPPRVTVGNGRSPGILSDDDPEPRWRAPSADPAPVPPPPPPPVALPTPSLVDRISTPPALPKQLGVAPAADWTDPVWGIAGLLLIPAAGAALGYRQARAAHAAERLGRA